MIRILHMIGSLEMGGSQTMVMTLYRSIDKEKFQFDFIIDCDTKSVFEEEIKRMGGKIFRLPKFNGINFMKVGQAWNDFFQNHPEYKILHSHVRSYASLYLPIAKAHEVRTIIHSHNTSNGKGLTSVIKCVLQYPLRFQADYFFGCSEMAGRWLFGEKIVQSDRYFMLRNAVDLERFAYQPQIREKIRYELGVDTNTLLIGHVGRMNPQKNHHFLIDCFYKVTNQRSDVKLLLLGDGELRGKISQQIRQSGLENQVIMPGVKENVEEYFSAMDCFLLPSLHEGLPVVVVEAQANGLQCFLSDAVTKEVQLSELVQYLPITQGDDPWVNALLNCKNYHKDVTKEIKDSGFCVKESSKWLSDFYQKIAE